MARVLYPLFFLISILITRDKRKWVFGNQKGYYDNTKYFFEYVSLYYKDKRAYWLANSLEEYNKINKMGHKALLKNSVKGYWVSSRAGFTFICNGYGDVNRLLAITSRVINFWHGTPIKKIYFDSEEIVKKINRNKLLSPLLRYSFLFLNRNIDFYYAANEFERVKVTSAARIDINKSISIGSPRFDYMRNASTPRELVDLAGERKIILYAPTWRPYEDWHPNFYLKDVDFQRLNYILDKKSILLVVKPHPLTKIDFLKSLGLKESSNIIYADSYGLDDINSLYKHVDFLITDLSSSVFDFLIFDKPIKLFMPDYEFYIDKVGIYEKFVDIIRNDSCISWEQLCNEISVEDWGSNKLLDDIAKESSSYEDVCKNIMKDLERKGWV